MRLVKRPSWTGIAIAASWLAAGCAQPSGSPLEGLERLKDFETRRASSSDANWRNGNADARPIAPGATLTVAELEGPGRIVHIWCTIAHQDPYYSRMLTLRIYWDGESNPSVECPIGDFFGIGHGVDRAYDSMPIRVTSDGRGRNCYWPMPFRKSARITVTNDSDRNCGAFYYYVDWQKHRRLPDDVAYFHAMYRQEFPCVMGRNYLLADIEGRGHYVGTVQSVYMVSPGWYGEGDDFFFIDGETEPSLRGTGTEDYFCDAWGFKDAERPFYGIVSGKWDEVGDKISGKTLADAMSAAFKDGTSGHMSMDMGGSITAEGDFQVADGKQNSTMTMEVAGSKMEMISVGGKTYMKSPMFAGGTKWVSMDSATAGDAGAPDVNTFDPETMAKALGDQDITVTAKDGGNTTVKMDLNMANLIEAMGDAGDSLGSATASMPRLATLLVLVPMSLTVMPSMAMLVVLFRLPWTLMLKLRSSVSESL